MVQTTITHLAERLRQHQPAWQPTNGYDYDPWHVPEPRQAALVIFALVFPSAPPSFPTSAALLVCRLRRLNIVFFTQTPDTKAKAPCVQPTHLPTKAPPPCVLRQIHQAPS